MSPKNHAVKDLDGAADAVGKLLLDGRGRMPQLHKIYIESPKRNMHVKCVIFAKSTACS